MERNEKEGFGIKRKRGGVDWEETGIYVGESSRSMYERTKEHIADARAGNEDSHIAKHWAEQHRGEDMPKYPFRFKIIKTFQDSLSRQVSESVRIDLRKGVLNSKTVYSRNKLPRLEIAREEWEKEDEERRQRYLKEQEQERNIDKHTIPDVEMTPEEEQLVSETWRRTGMSRNRQTVGEDLRPTKRKRVRDRIKDTDVMWGLEPTSEEGNGVIEWLYGDMNSSHGEQHTKQSKQQKLEPWSWLKLEAWRMVVEMARNIEKVKEQEKQDQIEDMELAEMAEQIEQKYSESKQSEYMEKEGIECDKKTSEIDPNKKSSKSGIGKSRKGKCQDSEDRSKAANQDIRTMMERNRRSANELKEARAKKEGQDVAGQQKLTHSLQRAGEQKLTNKEEDTLLYNHLVFWEREECMMEGSGMEMEWENTCITQVMGYGCDNYRKRIHGKKQRWTNQAKDMARMAGKVPRMIKRAGRRLEG